MRRGLIWGLLWAVAVAGRAEVIDRVAVTVDKIVITESDIIHQIRVAAFLNEEPVDVSPKARREAARRLVEQVLIRREMEISRYPAPAPPEVEPLLQQVKQNRFPDEKSFRAALARYRITEAELRQSLLVQLTTVRFIDYRFRPGVAVSDEEIGEYYQKEFLPEWRRRGSGAPPPLEDTREQIEQILISRQVNQALDKWLRQAAAGARIEYREAAFQ